MRLYHGIATSFLWAEGQIHDQCVRAKNRKRVQHVLSHVRRRRRCLHHLITSAPPCPTEIVYKSRMKTDSIRRLDTQHPGLQVVAVFLTRALLVLLRSGPSTSISDGCEMCGRFWGGYRLSWRVCLGHTIARRINDERKIMFRLGHNRSSIRLRLCIHKTHGERLRRR